MKYTKLDKFDHGQAEKIGVLVTNLGTPDAPTGRALKPYLKQFLSDPRVVEFPRLLWWLILNGVILNVRPSRSAKSYAKVWTDAGSPLAVHTKAIAETLAQSFGSSTGEINGIDKNNCIFDWAMRYGEPSIESKIDSFIRQGVKKLLVVPLYPQYSATTTGSTFDALASDFIRRRWIPELRFVTGYCDLPEYIEALVASIKKHWEQRGPADKLIFSYHGIPQRYLDNGDPYHCLCYKTTRLVAESLGLESEAYMTTFQSRFGREPWLQPYTDETLKKLAGDGVKSVQVICPGFSADCLETIEEIGMENRDYFIEEGGERFEYIPALNSSLMHIKALKKLIEDNLQGWGVRSLQEIQESQKRALDLGSA